ncbi:transient receptor potential cation channel subfamily V member 5-like [Patiria miniata]|uniref:Ion transport domain-containing protein n=1 Tax=Patiria miniata TaxID=46514 RepID=A0A914AZT8_PATMI|nr:transient receptor potential cation channel subfamily V member 5-like [Patiria miniata]
MGATVGAALRRYLQCQCFSLGLMESDDSEWRKQNENKNPMYDLLYFSGQGTLVQCYLNRKSDAEFIAQIRKEVGPYLYNDGQGKTINEWDYIQYRKNNVDQKKKNIMDAMSDQELMLEFHEYQQVAINRFTEHQACWDLCKRGEVGETILHLCYLNNTKVHREIARFLLEMYPKLALDVYEGADYYGENAVHMAIVNKDMESVRLLVGQYNAELDRRATGRFFRPNDFKDPKQIKLKLSNYEGDVYFGEYLLAFAAGVGSTEIYDYLINESLKKRPGQGQVNPNAKDSYGNTVVHMVIIHNQKTMFKHVIQHSKMPANYHIPNNAGLTPLELSYRLGRSELFARLLDLASETQWAYGNLAYVAYPLGMLDTIGENGELNKHSALRTIIKKDDPWHLKMLEGQVINQLLQEKWKRYARGRFMFKFVWACLHLTLLSLSVTFRPAGDLLSGDDSITKFRYFTEVCVIIGCVAKTAVEGIEIRSRGSLLDYIKSLYVLPFKGLFMCAIIMLYICVPLRFLGLRQMEDMLLIIIMPFSFAYILFFYRGHEKLGPLIVMIGKMTKGDVSRFAIIYVIFIIIFGEAFFYLFKGVDPETAKDFQSWNGSFMMAFLMAFGDFPYEVFGYSRIGWLSQFIFFIFMLLVPWLLVNMLIAMMAKTYQQVEERSKMEWKRQWAMLLLNIERSIPKGELQKYQKAYSTEMRMPYKEALRKGLIQDTEEATGKAGGTIIISPDEGEAPPIPKGRRIMYKSWKKDDLNVPLVPITRSEGPIDAESGTRDKEYVCRALLIQTVLPKSRAKARREALVKWRGALRKVIRANRNAKTLLQQSRAKVVRTPRGVRSASRASVTSTVPPTPFSKVPPTPPLLPKVPEPLPSATSGEVVGSTDQGHEVTDEVAEVKSPRKLPPLKRRKSRAILPPVV